MKRIKATARIVLLRRDQARLMQLANGWMASRPDFGDDLLAKLGAAKLVEQSDTTVQIGSTLVYASDNGENRQVTLVYPEQADIALGKVSVLTPIGSALLGRAAGDTVEVLGNDGRSRRLTIVQLVGDGNPAPKPKAA